MSSHWTSSSFSIIYRLNSKFKSRVITVSDILIGHLLLYLEPDSFGKNR